MVREIRQKEKGKRQKLKKGALFFPFTFFLLPCIIFSLSLK